METNFNKEIVKSIAELFFYESSIKSEWLPIDLDYIDKNKGVLKKIKLEDFIIYSLNNFPEIYNHRLLLSLSSDLQNLEKEAWFRVVKELDSNTSINSFFSFLRIYLKINPSFLTKYISKKDFSFYELESYELDEDDLAFIAQYLLGDSIEQLKEKLNKSIFR